MKKIISLFLSMVLILVFSTTALAATPVTPVENVNVLYASFRNASGYGQATGLSNTNGLFTVPVTGSGSNGYGITLKTRGSGTATISIVDPNGNTLYLGGNFGQTVIMSNTSERAWNLKGVKYGTYKVYYTVMGGSLDIICHIYG